MAGVRDQRNVAPALCHLEEVQKWDLKLRRSLSQAERLMKNEEPPDSLPLHPAPLS